MSPEALARAWPPFFEAILANEADQYAAEIMQKMVTVAGYLARLRRQHPAGPGGTPSPGER